jgi:hypothetical protein
MVDSVQEHPGCIPFRYRCEPSRRVEPERTNSAKLFPQAQAQGWDQPIRVRPHRPELGMALPSKLDFIVYHQRGIVSKCDAIVRPSAVECVGIGITRVVVD